MITKRKMNRPRKSKQRCAIRARPSWSCLRNWFQRSSNSSTGSDPHSETERQENGARSLFRASNGLLIRSKRCPRRRSVHFERLRVVIDSGTFPPVEPGDRVVAELLAGALCQFLAHDGIGAIFVALVQ